MEQLTSFGIRQFAYLLRDERGVALEKLLALQTSVGNIRRRPLSWIPDAIHGVLSDQDRPWRELLHATTTTLENLRERARNAHARRVQLPDGIERQQAQPNRPEVNHEAGISPVLREYISVAKQKRPYGVLIYEEIGHVVLELVPHQGRIDRKELIRNAADALDFPEAAFKRIDEAIRRLKDLNKVCADSNYVWRRTL